MQPAQAIMNHLVFSVIFLIFSLIFWLLFLIFESFLHFSLTSLIFGSFQVWADVGDRALWHQDEEDAPPVQVLQ